MQVQVTQFTSECNKAKIYVENDMPIGVFHDFLMSIKGAMVDRMITAHQEQLKQAQDAVNHPSHGSEFPDPSENSCSSNCSA